MGMALVCFAPFRKSLIRTTKFVQSSRMSYTLICVRVALATSDVQIFVEIPATDELHMEGRNQGFLPETSRTMAYTYTPRKTVCRLARKQLHLNKAKL